MNIDFIHYAQCVSRLAKRSAMFLALAATVFATQSEHQLAAYESPTAEESWPQWRGPLRDGKSATTGIRRSWESQPPELLWMSEGAGGGYASVSIANGLIFTSGNKQDGQAITAMRQSDGEVVWSTTITDDVPKHGYPGSRTTPTISEGKLYAVASDGQIVCLNAENGDKIWSRNFSDWEGKMMSGWGFSESPLVDGDWVLCTPGGNDAAIVALDKNSGEEVWRSALERFGDGKNKHDQDLKQGAGYSSIVISNGGGVKQYIQVLGQGIIGVRASDGQFLWGYEDVVNRVANIPTPIVTGDYLFCSTSYQTGSALLKLTGRRNQVSVEEVYFLNYRDLQNHHGGMILVDGHVYGGHGHNEGFPICVDLESGETVWNGGRGPGKKSAAVVYVDGMLIFRYQDGVVGLIEATPEGYQLKGSFMPEYQERESWAHPVVVDGRLYLREQDKMMCYELR